MDLELLKFIVGTSTCIAFGFFCGYLTAIIINKEKEEEKDE